MPGVGHQLLILLVYSGCRLFLIVVVMLYLYGIRLFKLSPHVLVLYQVQAAVSDACHQIVFHIPRRDIRLHQRGKHLAHHIAGFLFIIEHRSGQPYHLLIVPTV